MQKGNVDEIHGYQEITFHVIFDVKMDFTQKAGFVTNGSNNEAQVEPTYSRIVSRDSVQISLLIS